MPHEIIFRQLLELESSTYTYVLGCPATKEAVLIDPVLETVNRDIEIISEMGLKLKYALNTHCHADHITGTGKIRSKLPDVKSMIAKASGAEADIHLEDGDVVKFGEQELKVLATPGHTSGCLTYYTPKNGGMVFTGDALLIRACGRTDFQQGSSDLLYDSIMSKIFTLPDHTVVYPGHDYKGRTSSTVGEEKKYNPRLSKSKEQFTEIMKSLNLPYPRKIDASLPANLVDGKTHT